MAPDINSLSSLRPPSASPTPPHTMQTNPGTLSNPDNFPPGTTTTATSGRHTSDHSRRTSSSNQARGSSHLDRALSDRRRSQVASTSGLGDPGSPNAGELSTPEHRASVTHSFSAASPMSLGGRGTIATGDPHHQRQPSLGEIHNELEQEQEAQVNRMLYMIRSQQNQLETLQRSQTERSQNETSTTATIAEDQPTPSSERSLSFAHRPRTISRHPSNTSVGRSPALRPRPSQEGYTSAAPNFEWFPPSSPLEMGRRNSNRDESAYYQAETANLTRENQMLKIRIRELEKQLADKDAGTGGDLRSDNSAALHPNIVASSALDGQTGHPRS